MCFRMMFTGSVLLRSLGGKQGKTPLQKSTCIHTHTHQQTRINRKEEKNRTNTEESMHPQIPEQTKIESMQL